MGTIRKQSILGTIVVYIGVVVGFVNTGLLLPKLFSTDEIGLINVLVAYATIFAQFSSLGFNNATIRMFPHFRNGDNKHNGFMGLGIFVISVGLLISLAVFFLLRDTFLNSGLQKSSLFIEYYKFIIPLLILILLFLFFDTYLRVLYRSTVGLVLKEVVQRVIIFVSIILFYFDIVDFSTFLYLYIVAFAIPVVVAIFLVIRSGDFSLRINLKFLSRDFVKELINVCLFGIIAGFMGVITVNIDRLMVQHYLGLSATGIYSTAFFFGTVVALPVRSVVKISTTFIAESWKKNDVGTIKTIYSKSSITQLVFGFLVFGGLIINLDNIIEILGPQYASGRFVIVFIGLAYLADMAMGVGGHILVTSRYYKYQTYLLLMFFILVILSNIIFIPIMGIVGAALASLMSKVLHDGIKMLVVYRKLKMQPFTKKSIAVSLIAVISIAVCYFIPISDLLIVNIAIRSVVFVLLFISAVYFFNISNDINNRINTYLGVIKKIIKRD